MRQKLRALHDGHDIVRASCRKPQADAVCCGAVAASKVIHVVDVSRPACKQDSLDDVMPTPSGHGIV